MLENGCVSKVGSVTVDRAVVISSMKTETLGLFLEVMLDNIVTYEVTVWEKRTLHQYIYRLPLT